MPFNDAVATRYLKHLGETLRFQSSLDYLQSPPDGYQQSPVDLLAELREIQDSVTAGIYRNQYSFEAAVQSLLQRSHDSHLAIFSGIMDTFSFSRYASLPCVDVHY